MKALLQRASISADEDEAACRWDCLNSYQASLGDSVFSLTKVCIRLWIVTGIFVLTSPLLYDMVRMKEPPGGNIRERIRVDGVLSSKRCW